jgi:hypothetical protein
VWIRTGLIRESIQLPGGNEVRISAAEITRLRDYAIGRLAMSALGDDAEPVESASSGTPPWRR